MATANAPSPAGQASQLQLHDIHLPEQVSGFPIAPGWWLLVAIIIFTAIWAYKKHQKNKRLNASKKQAMAMLTDNKTLSAKDCIALLKWAAMQYFSRQQLAKLYGENFQAFLIEQLPEKHQLHFTELTTAAFKSQYQAKQVSVETVDQDCQQAAKLWLSHALPVINSKEHSK